MLSYFLLFLLVFDLAIPPVGFIGSSPFVLLICLIFLNSEKWRVFGELLYKVRRIFVLYGAIVGYAIVRVLFSQEMEVEFILTSFKAFNIFISCVLYFSIFYSKDLPNKIINIFFINGIICLIIGSFPNLLFLVDFFKNGITDEPNFIPYRNAFLAGSGYFGIGAAYAIVIALGCYLLVNQKNSLFFIFKLLVILIAGIISARTAFVGFAIGCSYIVFKRPTYSIYLALMVALVVGAILFIPKLSVYSEWIFEMFSTSSNDGGLATKSTNELFTMYFMPDFGTFTYGDGRYVDGSLYYMGTDAGYMRHLLFGGIFFVLLVIWLSIKIALHSKNKFYFFFLLPLMLVLHFKGVFILSNPAGMAVLILLSLWFNNKASIEHK